MEFEVETVAGVITVVVGRFGDQISSIRFGAAEEESGMGGSTMRVKRPVQEFVGALHDYGQDPTIQIPVETLDFSKLSDFQRKVYEELMRIPVGKTLTYAELAEAIGSPDGARAVGTALGRNPFPIAIPCHRVVAADGSLGGYLGGEDAKKKLLAHERAG